jgi:multidrug resistance efflux pump
MTYRLDLFRDRALARKAVVSQEAEVAEAITQLADLDEFRQQLRESLSQVESGFAQGRVSAPVAGIVSTNVARVGESLVAGSPVAEILDPTDVFVDWYVPNVRLFDPKAGRQVFVLFGNRRITGTIERVLPVSAQYGPSRASLISERQATQIARIRFNDRSQAPPLNSSVTVHMHYWPFVATMAEWAIDLFGIGGIDAN